MPSSATYSASQALRQHEIDLQRAALPLPPDRIAQHEFQLGAVERALAGIEHVVDAGDRTRLLERALRAIPRLVAARTHSRAIAEPDVKPGKTEIRVDRAEQVDEADCLVGDLRLGAEDMRVVLREGPHPHDAVQRARRLIAVAGAELGHAQRQLAVAAQAVAEDQHMAGAVHRLQRERLVLALDGGDEHVLAEFLPVARRLPQRTVDQLGRLHFLVAGGVEAAAHVVLRRAIQAPALGMPEHAADRLLLEVEQIHVAADLAVVAPLGFGELMQMGIQLLLVAPRGAVDAAEHGVAMVAAPIGPGDLHQLERRADVAHGAHVRAAAEVDPVALPVERDDFRAG